MTGFPQFAMFTTQFLDLLEDQHNSVLLLNRKEIMHVFY